MSIMQILSNRVREWDNVNLYKTKQNNGNIKTQQVQKKNMYGYIKDDEYKGFFLPNIDK